MKMEVDDPAILEHQSELLKEISDCIVRKATQMKDENVPFPYGLAAILNVSTDISASAIGMVIRCFDGVDLDKTMDFYNEQVRKKVEEDTVTPIKFEYE